MGLLQGQLVLRHGVLRAILHEPKGRGRWSVVPDERQFRRMWLQGLRLRVIAAQLGISRRTVDETRRRLELPARKQGNRKRGS